MRIHITEKQALSQIRSATCYGVLRGVVNVVALLVATVSAILAIMVLIGDGKSYTTEDLRVRFIAILPLIYSFVMSLAGRQLVLMFVDMADAAVADYKRKRNGE